jgi:hypothetical protein
VQVVAITTGAAEEAQNWIQQNSLVFPVLVQEHWSVSRRYEVFATPFAFVIDEQGVIRSKGIATTRRYLQFLLAPTMPDHRAAESAPTIERSEAPRAIPEGSVA